MWSRGYTPRSHRQSGYSQPDLRVGDSERTDVADRLSRHYADGRLDQAEFNERLDRSMRAKTRSDLGGLFDDLPTVQGSEVATRRRHAPPHYRRLLFLVLLVVVVGAVGQSLIHANLPWIVLSLLVLFWFRGSWHRRH
jgi:hypothetical protein